MKKIFISRQLDEDDVFYKTLTINGFEVHGESLLAFKPVPFAAWPPTDWVFFYSKTAANFFLANVGQSALAGLKLAALGPGTAKFLSGNGHTPHFVGDGDPPRTAANFLKLAGGCQVLFPRARESRQSVQRLLGDRIIALDLVVYENSPRVAFSLPKCQVLVFTSPMNAQVFFAKYKWKGEKVVAMGNTTAAALRSLGVGTVFTAEKPSEEALAKLVQLLME